MVKFCLAALVYVQLALGSALAEQRFGKHLSPHGRFDKIIRGHKTDIRRVPFQVSLGQNIPSQHIYARQCGGSIISEEWVISAAHCLYEATGERSKMNTVIAGHTKLADPTRSFHRIVEVAKPPDDNRNYEDIVLVRVSPPFQFDAFRQPVQLLEQNEEILPGTFATATGWGKNADGESQRDLQLVQIPILSRQRCNRLFDVYRTPRMKSDEICGGYPMGGYGVCNGDSGGPLTVGQRLAGIVSHTYGPCGLLPARYTSIAFYRDWIRQVSGI